MAEENSNRNALKIRYTRKKLLEIGNSEICKKMPDSFKAFCKNLAEHQSNSFSERQKYSQSHDWMVNTAYDPAVMYQQPLNEHKMYMRTFQVGGSHNQMFHEQEYFPQRQAFVTSACGMSDIQAPASKRNKPSFWPVRFPNQHYQNKYLESNHNDEFVNRSGTKSKRQNADIPSKESISVNQAVNEKSESTESTTKDWGNIKSKDDDKENVHHERETENGLEVTSNEMDISKTVENQWFSKHNQANIAKDFLECSQPNCQLVGNVLFHSPGKEFSAEVNDDNSNSIYPSFSTPTFGKHGKGDGVKQSEIDPKDIIMTSALDVTQKEYFNLSTNKKISPSRSYLTPDYKVNNSAVCDNNAPSDITNIMTMSALRIQSKHHSGQGDSPKCFMAEKDKCYLRQTEPTEAHKQELLKSMFSDPDPQLPSIYHSIQTPEAKADFLSESPTSAETKQKKSPREIFPDLTQLQPEQKMEGTAKTTPKIINPRALFMQLPSDIRVLVKNAKPTTEMLGRTEAIATLSGLKNGQMTLDHLARQLQNSALQQRHKELLACILKMCIQDPLLTGQAAPDPSPAGSVQKQEGLAEKPAVTWVLAKVPTEQLVPTYCQLVQSPKSGMVYSAPQLLVGPRSVLPLPARIAHKSHAARLLQEQLRQLSPSQCVRSFGAEELDSFNLQPAPEDS